MEDSGSLLFILFAIVCSVLQIASGRKKKPVRPSVPSDLPDASEAMERDSDAGIPDTFPDDLPGMPPVFRFPDILKSDAPAPKSQPEEDKPFSYDAELEKHAFAYQKEQPAPSRPAMPSTPLLDEEMRKAPVQPEAFSKDGLDIRSAILYDALLHPKSEE